MPEQRKIIHVDMDAFYASVEQRDNPGLRGRPVLVGGRPEERGVVAACSYEARRFGVHSAMSSAQAARRCPQAIFVSPRFDVYREVSLHIREVFYEYTDFVEPLSLDEAYLDVTQNKKGMASGTWMAQEIRAQIFRRVRLTASAGVSYNKFLAKVASDCNKPDGLTVVTPEQAAEFLAGLPIRRFHGVGKVTEQKMKEHGIFTGAELRERTLQELTSLFGKVGHYFYQIARGKDTRPVQPNRARKSLSKETTLRSDCVDLAEMLSVIRRLAERLVALFESGQPSGCTLTLKVKYADFQTITRSATFAEPIVSLTQLLEQAALLLQKTEAGERPVRLLGLGVSNLTASESVSEHRQLKLPFRSNRRIVIDETS